MHYKNFLRIYTAAFCAKAPLYSQSAFAQNPIGLEQQNCENSVNYCRDRISIIGPHFSLTSKDFIIEKNHVS
jgi:hypothetical protein